MGLHGLLRDSFFYDMARIDSDASNNSSIVACLFVAAVTNLPSRCLANRGGYTYRHRLMGWIYEVRLLRWTQVP
jgi:hypothetical protein